MKNAIILFVTFILVVWITPIFGQVKPSNRIQTLVQDECSCDNALKDGVRDDYRLSSGSDYKSALKIVFTHEYTYWATDEWRKESSVETGAAYLAYSGFFSGDMSESAKRTKFESMKQYYSLNQDIAQSDYKFISQKITSKDLMAAWVECYRIHCSNADVILLNKEISGSEFTVTLTWKHKNTRDIERITSIVSINAEQQSGGDLTENRTISGQSSYTCKFRITDPHKDVSVRVNVSEYETDPIYIPGIPLENPANNSPVGTIVASVLPWNIFCQANSLPSVLNYQDRARCKWAPADGRSVVGSLYGQYANNVPDLRGVFLRGLNDFGLMDVPNVSTQQQDPDGSGRRANTLQTDQVKRHHHNMKPSLGGSSICNTFIAGGNEGSDCHKPETYEDYSYGGAETRPRNISVYYYIKIN